MRGIFLPKRYLNKKPKSWIESSSIDVSKSFMPLNHFVQAGDPILRAKCLTVDPSELSSPLVRNTINQLLSVLKKYDAVGASAPQIGVPLSIIALGFSSSQMKFWSTEVIRSQGMVPFSTKVVINPKIEILDTTQSSFREGCCSVYGYSGLVSRPREVLLTGLTAEGTPFEWRAKDWAARIAQHEVEHLDGKLFWDNCDPKTLEFNYWRSVNRRNGDFKLSFNGIGNLHKFLPFKILFRQK